MDLRGVKPYRGDFQGSFNRDSSQKKWKADKRDLEVPNMSPEASYNVKSLACSNWQATYFGGG